MSERKSAFRRAAHTAREYLTHWVIGGAFIMATGFAPEHWLAHLAEHLHLPGRIVHLWPNVIDVRAILVFVGVAIIVGDFILRRRALDKGALAAPISVEPSAGPPADPPLPEKPSIAILPFDNMSDDKDQEFLADGIVEDTLAALSQISSLFVVARNSSFAFKGKNADVREVGRQLGVRYVLEGSVRRSADRLRVTAQLIDALNGAHVWAERYERPVNDIFDIQDELTKEIVTALRIKLTDGEQANIWLRSTSNVEAWGYAMRGADHIWRGTATDMAQARVLLERAVDCDPAYAKGAALIALTYYYDLRFSYTPSREEAKHKATEWTAKALELDRGDLLAKLMQSLVMTLDNRFGDAVEGMKQVVARSPNDAFAWATYARVLVNAEQPVEAERAVRHAMRLNPFYPVNYLAVLADALVHQARNDEALEVLKELVKRQPNYISAHLHMAGIYVALGQVERARAEVGEVLRINPQYRLAAAASFYLSSNEDRKRVFLESLRAAGLPN